MRMWMVDPTKMCRRHLLGEHLETHMFVGTLNKGISVEGYLSSGLLEVHSLKSRHDALAAEMVRRGGNHGSPLPDFESFKAGKVDVEESIKELIRRCENCRRLLQESSISLVSV